MELGGYTGPFKRDQVLFERTYARQVGQAMEEKGERVENRGMQHASCQEDDCWWHHIQYQIPERVPALGLIKSGLNFEHCE